MEGGDAFGSLAAQGSITQAVLCGLEGGAYRINRVHRAIENCMKRTFVSIVEGK
jgi:hypothetical protein